MTFFDQLPSWLPLVGTAIGGGGLVAVLRPVLDYMKGRRKQTDEVAMGLVEKLQTRIDRLEDASTAERQICDAKLETLRHQLKIVEGNFDALLLAIEVAPEKAAEVIAKIKARRDRDELAEERGERRNAAQRDLSTARVARDDA